MHYLLHIDTSTDISTASVGGNGVILSQITSTETRNHASTINVMIQNAIQDAGITLKQLAGIAVCAGPGSYTGLRIGMATAKGLCYVLDVPLFLDNKLTLLANQAIINRSDNRNNYTIVLTAREKEYFAAVYNNELHPIVAPQHITEDQLDNIFGRSENIYMIADTKASENYKSQVNISVVDSNINIDVSAWVTYTFNEYMCNQSVKLANAEPFYLKQVYTHS